MGLIVGDQVVMHTCLEAEKYKNKIWTVRTDPWKLEGHTEVVMLEGYSGCFATEFLTKLDDP
ncbi:hypothetical protein [Pseudobacteroides cellulosolvens]|uniref:Uncharacterized protein n=1 Tax=Pseudobacteroides cellulosolvens ATCC 35603 = DSM 2933 TaxID=398512 RepID=A0A0L6JGI6_9FIRM|nr:hypothetical protein [Pseudobacteroides cellulosolvens]KNY24819.1 hypothetical protein Bccel_0076 [Pseudobacteroides cellulosolvens ATCC 35603 = DSM 2933]